MIALTHDMDRVNLVLTHPDIWKDIAPDVTPFDAPYLPQCQYFMVGDGAGVVIFHPYRDGVKIHPNILPKYRGKLAVIAVEESIQAMFKAGYTSIYAQIDPQLRHVVMFARRLGFGLLEINDRHLFVRRKLDS